MLDTLSNIYFFNPTCEYAVANGHNSWQPNRILKKMEYDLAVLPIYFSKANDYVVVDKMPSEHFLSSLQKITIEPPQFILKNEIKNPAFNEMPINRLLPWGWSPAAHKLLAPLKESCSEEFKKSPVYKWKQEHREIYSKKFSLNILRQLISEYKTEYFITPNFMPEICTTQNEIEKRIAKWGRIMVKAPWSSSGRGLQPVTKVPVHSKVWEKIMGIVHEQGYVIVEPFLNKILDFSFQFELEKGKITFLGLSNFCTDKKGQYLGNSLNGWPENVSKRVIEFQKNAIKNILKPLIFLLEKSALAKLYEGNFGVDTLIFSDENNQLKINPCLEINVRQNMGLLSLKLQNLIPNEKKAIFRTFYIPGTSFGEFVREMGTKYPLIISNKKIESGFFPLTEATENSQFGAYLLV